MDLVVRLNIQNNPTNSMYTVQCMGLLWIRLYNCTYLIIQLIKCTLYRAAVDLVGHSHENCTGLLWIWLYSCIYIIIQLIKCALYNAQSCFGPFGTTAYICRVKRLKNFDSLLFKLCYDFAMYL